MLLLTLPMMQRARIALLVVTSGVVACSCILQIGGRGVVFFGVEAQRVGFRDRAVHVLRIQLRYFNAAKLREMGLSIGI